MPLIFIFTPLAKCISTDGHSFTHVPKISDGGLALSLFSFKKILIRDLKKCFQHQLLFLMLDLVDCEGFQLIYFKLY